MRAEHRRAELEGTVHVYTRAAATAPPDMARQLDYHRKHAAGLAAAGRAGRGRRRHAACQRLPRRGRRGDPAGGRAERRPGHPGCLGPATRGQAPGRPRGAPRARTAAGSTAEPERSEPESLIQLVAAVRGRRRRQPTGQSKRQHQAAIDAGQPWPPTASHDRQDGGPSRRTKPLEQPQQDGHQPGLGPAKTSRRPRYARTCPARARAGT